MGKPPVDPRDHDIRDELRFHIEERTKELQAQGLSPDEARRGALEAFGDPAAVAERVRRARGDGRTTTRGGRMLADLGRDLRYALRSLANQPVFTAAAVLTLALAIGANAAIFGVADRVLLRTPPVREPGSLVSVYTTCRAGDPRCASSWPDYLDYRTASSLEDLAGWSWLPVSAATPGEPPRLLTAMMVTGNYFEMLGVPAARGRALRPSDDVPGAPTAVAVLAHGTWRGAFGADPAVVGRTLRFNEVPFEIVGVAPEGFRGTSLSGDPDVFLPITSGALLGVGAVSGETIWEERGSRWIDALVGRLAPGATVDALQDEMRALAVSLNEAYPDDRGSRQITVDPASRYALPQFGRD
ncbi:MAG TPA: ABC transporter permease, partial [Candidatus Thermoplasmatota archaeon]